MMAGALAHLRRLIRERLAPGAVALMLLAVFAQPASLTVHAFEHGQAASSCCAGEGEELAGGDGVGGPVASSERSPDQEGCEICLSLTLRRADGERPTGVTAPAIASAEPAPAPAPDGSPVARLLRECAARAPPAA